MKRAMLNSSARRVLGFLILGLSICLMTATGNAQYQAKKESPSPNSMQKAESGKMMVPDGQVKTPGPGPKQIASLSGTLCRPGASRCLSQIYQQDPNPVIDLIRVVDDRTNRLILSTSPAIWAEVEIYCKSRYVFGEDSSGAMRLVTFSPGDRRRSCPAQMRSR